MFLNMLYERPRGDYIYIYIYIYIYYIPYLFLSKTDREDLQQRDLGANNNIRINDSSVADIDLAVDENSSVKF